ncbi:hypothetical protein AMJ85_03235 [candidate division BRC1 bacterium SM23_51]|nr:MAG: hypothetical protein AMJ85_03235 [candidate division BRC1 bacterium SM23_51]
MPERYQIETESAPPRFRPVGRLGIVDWREDCAGCHNCVKRSCIYDLYRNENAYLQGTRGFLDYVYQCKGCLSCVQNCTKALLTRIVNPDYERLGDEYYTPAIILVTWFQAETGRIPVSGTGYGGPFAGRGFDAMWTDMSEIVRPTRDGIHGREYISTLVDIGRKPPFLRFNDGQVVGPAPALIQSPLPILLDCCVFQSGLSAKRASPRLRAAAVEVADRTGTWAVVPEEEIGEAFGPERHRVVPLLSEGDEGLNESLIRASRMVEVRDSARVFETIAKIKSLHRDVIVAIRVAVETGCADRVSELAKQGAEVVHVVFDPHGREQGEVSGFKFQVSGSDARHARTVLREIHGRLVEQAIRDEVTLIASGGIAVAEHMAKAIICGADLVAIDLPMIIALECRLCRGCERGQPCPVELQNIEHDYAVRRMTNLLAAWHLQLLEVMGAMGMREVRRLRGETGRAMFHDDLEREIFAPLFANPET